MEEKNLAYESAGVNLEAGYESVRLIKDHIRRTRREEVLSDIGGFGGLFRANFQSMEDPIMVSGTDGVGTKLKLAFVLEKHDTIGQDCVAMCVNDIICSAAEPLFFLDYIACGKNYPEKIEQIVKGVADACEAAGCALIGGETAEMPGFYPVDEYDLAGFAVGVVDKKDIPDGSTMRAGDVLVAIPSSGVHSNGFSLVRKIFDLDNQDSSTVRQTLSQGVQELGKTLGEALLEPTVIYVKAILELIKQMEVKGLCHITGGGFYENIPRMFPEEGEIHAKIDREKLQVSALFDYIAQAGNVSEKDMFNTFNMGVGMIVCVAPENADRAIEILNNAGHQAYAFGEIVEQIEDKEESKDQYLWI